MKRIDFIKQFKEFLEFKEREIVIPQIENSISKWDGVVAGLSKKLKELSKNHDQFHYFPCLKDECTEDAYLKGELSEIVMSACSNFSNTTAFVCGNPDMVFSLKKKLYIAGFDLENILSDSFVAASLT